jgi:hypothetical protein
MKWIKISIANFLYSGAVELATKSQRCSANASSITLKRYELASTTTHNRSNGRGSFRMVDRGVEIFIVIMSIQDASRKSSEYTFENGGSALSTDCALRSAGLDAVVCADPPPKPKDRPAKLISFPLIDSLPFEVSKLSEFCRERSLVCSTNGDSETSFDKETREAMKYDSASFEKQVVNFGNRAKDSPILDAFV